MTITVTVDYQRSEAHVESRNTHHHIRQSASGVWTVDRIDGRTDSSTGTGFDAFAEAVGAAVQAAVEVHVDG